MLSRIEYLSEKKLIGKQLEMSFSDNKTADLWRSFMPRRKEVYNRLNENLFSLQLYDGFDFSQFDVHALFTKWAAVEVSDFNSVPDGMETFVLYEGLYAVFIHQGAACEAEQTFRYIFQSWLPHSDYELDNKPHFEILGAKYKNNSPDSEEEIWIPIKTK